MGIYLLVLLIIAAGATVLAFSVIQSALAEGRVGLYDARGFYLVILVFVTFVLTSLAYFWGEARFEPVPEQLSESLMGVLFALCCCLAGLAYGLIRLKEANS
ncbi:hypothetical protein [Reinekea blandensis]|uniref:50S ribosomal protein L13 n=1 Tax=Reinekea blandensis MED297 TaxID=314283 RepID=A4BK42_9GAMM|nr:hypothetical protein [Reinekea blandensis]EAR07524.1 50S ribosomal protein L13 [Reinekea sp. MED297] [Reinekea blandensis MED297]